MTILNMEKSFLDRFLFRVLAVMAISLFVSELGDIKGLAVRLHTVEFYYEFGVTFLIAFVVTEMVYQINKVLNRKFPIHEAKWERGILQCIFGIALPALLVFDLASLYFSLNGIDILRTDYLVFAFPLVVVLLIVLNLLLILVPYFIWAYRMQKSGAAVTAVQVDVELEQKAVEPEKKPSIPIKVLNGASVLFLDHEQILMAYIINSRVVVQNVKGAELLTDYTLDELEQILSKEQFFRVNRQLIIVRSAYKGYTNIDYGKLVVILSPQPPVDATVSQIKAKKFREWVGV